MLREGTGGTGRVSKDDATRRLFRRFTVSMGICVSRDKKLNDANGSMLVSESVDGEVTTQTCGLVVRQSFFSISGDDADVMDEKNLLAYKVGGQMQLIGKTIRIKNSSGALSVVLDKPAMSVHTEYLVYSAINNGGETKEFDGTTMYKHALIQKSLVAFTTELTYYLYDKDGEKKALFLAKAPVFATRMAFEYV
jgi:hypothetical protein